MPPKQLPAPVTALEALLALAVVFVWGTNFVVIELGIEHFPPLLFATLRFGLAALPWLLFVARPPIPWRYLAAVGVLLGVGQFGVLFIAMKDNISPGLAPLVIQVQVFFTVGLSVWLFGEAVHRRNIAGLALGATGLWIIVTNLDAATTPKGLALTLFAAGCWAAANLVVKAAHRRHGAFSALGLMVWSSLFAVPPLALLSLLIEGGTAMTTSLTTATAGAWAAALWQSVGNTLFGFGVWTWLLSRHSAAVVTPVALLVPVFGMGAAVLVLSEPLHGWKLWAGGLILAGLAVNVLDPRHFRRAKAGETLAVD